ncbi:unnamed protein product, partial [Didymodactylos carnosus]
FLMSVLKFGYHFVTADLDTVWFDNPLKYLSTNIAQVVLQGQTHRHSQLSGGFICVHSTSGGKQFWQRVIHCHNKNMGYLLKTRMKATSKYTEQECINQVANETLNRRTQIHYLNEDLFPDGRRFFVQKLPQLNGVIPVVVHNNWIIGLDEKWKQFQSWNLLCDDATPTNDEVKFHKNLFKNFRLRIKILTYNRFQSLKRLLISLLTTYYFNDHVDLDIWIDHPSQDATAGTRKEWSLIVQYLSNKSQFHWPHGSLLIYQQKSHIELFEQWTQSARTKTDEYEILLVLEDDMTVSRYFYEYIKKALQYYYYNRTNYDPLMYGFSLQNQDTILGQTGGTKTRSRDIQTILRDDYGSPLFYKYQLLGK